MTSRKEAWRVAVCGAVALAVAMGIGRFVFAPLLPMMLHDGVLDLTAGGWLATVNYIGYFFGALLCMMLRGNPVYFIRLGLVGTVVLTFGMGMSQTLWVLVLLRAAAGIASALVLVFSSAWCLQRLTQLGAPGLAGVTFTGAGFGIVITGLPISAMVACGWSAHQGWQLFGIVALVLSALIWTTFSGHARTPGLQANVPNKLPPTQASVRHQREVTGLVVGYGIAGFGYIITATFLPVIAHQALPGSHWPDFFWPLFGFFMGTGALLAMRIPAHIDNRMVLSVFYVLQAAGILSSVIWPTVAGLIACSLLVGFPFSLIVLFAMREARRLRGDHASRLMGLQTAMYGLGQIVGPPLATRLVHQTGSFTASLLVAVVALVLGAALFALMTYQTRREAHLCLLQ